MRKAGEIQMGEGVRAKDLGDLDLHQKWKRNKYIYTHRRENEDTEMSSDTFWFSMARKMKE